MKRFWLALIAIFIAFPAYGQSSVRPCWYNASGVCTFVSTANPFPVQLQSGGGAQPTNITQIAGNNIAAGAASGVLPIDALAGSALLAAAQAPLPTQASTVSIGGVGLIPNTASTIALTDVVCGSAVSSCVLKGAQGNFYGIYAECTAACWLMVFNSASAPSNGATTAGKSSGNLVDCIELPKINTTWQGSITYPTFPVNLNVGITGVISSTSCGTLTLSTVGFIHGTVM